MKNKLIILVTIVLCCFLPLKVEAASVSIAGTKATAVVGGSITVKVTLSESKGLGSWEFSIGYDSSMLQLTSGNAHVVEYVQGEGQTSKTYTYTFKVKKSGTATISVINTSIAAWDESMSSPTDSTTIECVTQETVTKNYSSNNNLKSLGVEGYNLEFNKDTTSYKLEVEADVKKVVIQAQAEDSKASISGAGEKEVNEGANSFDIVVTAENGTTKTYTLQVQVKELNPIKVTIDKKEYTVIRKIEEIKDLIPKHFEETKKKIEEEEVLAFHNNILDITLMALKDDAGHIGFYICGDDTYEKYEEITSGNITIRLLNAKDKIPKRYQKYTIKINDQDMIVYKLKKEDDFCLVYGQNVETGKMSLYQYDTIEQTLQRYQPAEVTLLEKDLQLRSYMIIGLLGILIVLLVVLLLLLKRKKNVKKIKKIKEEKQEFLK